MEQDREEILNKMKSEKMCSSDGNVVGEMCSPADTDTRGDGVLFGKRKSDAKVKIGIDMDDYYHIINGKDEE